MKKTTRCSIVNQVLLLGLWIGLAAAIGQVMQGQALWLRGLVALLALPVCGYVVQFGLSPMVNRLMGDRLPRRTTPRGLRDSPFSTDRTDRS